MGSALLPFLWMGVTYACLQCDGTVPCCKDWWNRWVNIGASSSDAIICAGIPSGPGALFELISDNNLCTPGIIGYSELSLACDRWGSLVVKTD